MLGATTMKMHCLGCGKELPDDVSSHRNLYQVCFQCGEIIQQNSHKEYSQVSKAVTRTLDLARTGNHLDYFS